MTNKEFYFDKLLAVVLKGNCDALYRMVYGKSCTGFSCRDCEFGITKESEIENILQWLNAEYEEPEPPLLENGDGLKPGDWIVVRYDDDEPWTKVQFLAYIDGVFYTREPLIGGAFKIMAYRQARLPMESE